MPNALAAGTSAGTSRSRTTRSSASARRVLSWQRTAVFQAQQLRSCTVQTTRTHTARTCAPQHVLLCGRWSALRTGWGTPLCARPDQLTARLVSALMWCMDARRIRRLPRARRDVSVPTGALHSTLSRRAGRRLRAGRADARPAAQHLPDLLIKPPALRFDGLHVLWCGRPPAARARAPRCAAIRVLATAGSP